MRYGTYYSNSGCYSKCSLQQTGSSNSDYKVHVFNEIRSTGKEEPDFLLKTKRVVSDVFNSKLGKFIGVPVCENDFAYLCWTSNHEQEVDNAIASEYIKIPGYEISEPVQIFGTNKISDIKYYQDGYSAYNTNHIECHDLQMLVEDLFGNTNEEFKKKFIQYYLLSEFIQISDCVGLNNVSIAVPINDDVDMESFKMPPAIDFGETSTVAETKRLCEINRWINKDLAKQRCEKVFTKKPNSKNLSYAASKYPEVVSDFAKGLQPIHSNKFNEITNLGGYSVFLKDESEDCHSEFDMDLFTGTMNRGLKKRAEIFQEACANL